MIYPEGPGILLGGGGGGSVTQKGMSVPGEGDQRSVWVQCPAGLGGEGMEVYRGRGEVEWWGSKGRVEREGRGRWVWKEGHVQSKAEDDVLERIEETRQCL